MISAVIIDQAGAEEIADRIWEGASGLPDLSQLVRAPPRIGCQQRHNQQFNLLYMLSPNAQRLITKRNSIRFGTAAIPIWVLAKWHQESNQLLTSNSFNEFRSIIESRRKQVHCCSLVARTYYVRLQCEGFCKKSMNNWPSSIKSPLKHLRSIINELNYTCSCIFIRLKVSGCGHKYNFLFVRRDC